MCHYLSEFENVGCKLYADLNGFKSPTELFNRLMPDIVLVRNDTLTITKLTCCFETNFAKSRLYNQHCKNFKWAIKKILKNFHHGKFT